MAYILGLIASDGNIAKKENKITIQLSAEDKNILEKIKEITKSSRSLDNYITKNNRDTIKFSAKAVPKNDNYVLASDYYRYTSPLQQGELSDKYPKNLQLREVIKRPSDAPFIDKDGKPKYDKSPRTPMPKPNFIETNKIIGR